MNNDVRQLVSVMRKDRMADHPERPVSLRQGVVISVDGSSLTLQLSGSEATIGGFRYLASYSPTVGDSVWLIKAGTDYIVLGDLA